MQVIEFVYTLCFDPGTVIVPGPQINQWRKLEGIKIKINQ